MSCPLLLFFYSFKRGKVKYADCILCYKANIPIAVIEAKGNHHSVADGMQQALDYSDILGDGKGKEPLPIVFSSNGDAFRFHDKQYQQATLRTRYCSMPFPHP